MILKREHSGEIYCWDENTMKGKRIMSKFSIGGKSLERIIF